MKQNEATLTLGELANSPSLFSYEPCWAGMAIIATIAATITAYFIMRDHETFGMPRCEGREYLSSTQKKILLLTLIGAAILSFSQLNAYSGGALAVELILIPVGSLFYASFVTLAVHSKTTQTSFLKLCGLALVGAMLLAIPMSTSIMQCGCFPPSMCGC